MPPATPDWQSLAAPHPLLRAVVIVPAKDEERLLPRCLAAQRSGGGAPVDPRSYEVVVLANNCSDGTAAVARRFAAAAAAARRDSRCAVHVAETTLPRQLAHVGQARRLLMDPACGRLRAARRRGGGAASGGRGVVVSTDGDSFVAPTGSTARWPRSTPAPTRWAGASLPRPGLAATARCSAGSALTPSTGCCACGRHA